MNRIALKRLLIKLLVLSLIITAAPLVSPEPIFATSASSPRCTGIYCSIVGDEQGTITGSSTARGYEGLIEIKGFNYESVNNSYLKINKSSEDMPTSILTIIKVIDKASPKLLKAFADSENLKEVKLDLIYVYMTGPTAGTQYKGYSIKLTEAKIIKRNIYAEPFIDNNNNISFNYYERISLSYNSIEETNTMPNTCVSPAAAFGICCKLSGENKTNITDRRKSDPNDAFLIDSFEYTHINDDNSGTSLQSIYGSTNYENILTSSLLTIKKPIDNSSTAILKAFMSEEKIPEVILYINIIQDTGETMSYYTIKLTNAVIVSRKLYKNPSVISFADAQPYEEISIAYDSITETSLPDSLSTSVNTIIVH